MTVTTPVLPEFLLIDPLVLLTDPPSATVSVPLPPFPTANRPELAQDEPVPVTVTTPVTPEPTEPISPLSLLTDPPSETVSVPLPETPTNKLLELVQDEPVPVTVATPVLPESKPINTKPLLTDPLSETVSVPLPPKAPTNKFMELVQDEPVPVTVTTPVLPGFLPINPLALLTEPPLMIVREPSADAPIFKSSGYG
nr:hypothetical protein [Pseudohoeflea suaedae]